jgi:tetratricopeptide (TPR) repeat protein
MEGSSSFRQAGRYGAVLMCAVAWAIAVTAGTAQEAPPEDPEVRALVERFFAAQQAEDAGAYLALWSTAAQRPRPEQLTFIFQAGDDRFSEIAITRVARVGDLMRVRVSVLRERTTTRPGVTLRPMTSRTLWSLTLVREEGALRILSEGVPADDLANALIAAASAEEREQWLAAEPDLLTGRLISALNRRADNLAQMQNFPAAIAIYERALEVARRVPDRKAEGEAQQSIGNAYYFLQNMPAALRAYQARLAIERELANEAGIAHALLGIATVRYSTYEYADALVFYREALGLYEKLGEAPGMASALISTGNVQYLQGDYDGAIADYRRSRDIYRKTFDTIGEARALDGLGRVHTAQGDYAAALEAYQGVREEGRARGNRATLASAMQSIGDVHFRLGNVETARAAFDESRQHYEALKDLAGTGRLWQAIARTDLAAGRFAPAEEGYTTSFAACNAARDSNCVASAIVGLAFAQQALEKYDVAIESYRKAIVAFTALDDLEAALRARIGLSQALFGKEAYPAARAEAVAAREPTTVLDVLWRAHAAEARALRRLGKPAEARASAEQALAIVRQMMAESLQRPSRRVPPDTTSAYTLLAILQAEAGDPAGTFDTLEQRLAHARRLALANNERDITRGMDPEARAEEHAATIRVMSTQAQIDKERELPKPDAARIARLETELAGAMQSRAAQQQRMFERWPDLRVWRGLSAPATVADLPAVLTDRRTQIVTFAIDDDDLLAVTARRDDGPVRLTAQVAAVRRHALAELVAAAVSPAALRDTAAWRKAAQALLKVLPAAAVEAMTTADWLIVVPDDVLWRVPVEALPRLDGYVGDRASVGYAGSVTSWLQAAGAGGPSASTAMLVAALPDVSPALTSRFEATAPGWTLRARAATEREVGTVTAPFVDPPASVLSGAAATERALRTAAPPAAALHLALPFRLNSASPLFSPLVTSNPAPPAAPGAAAEELPVTPPALDPEDDGTLEAREIMNLQLGADVAVLSDGQALSMRDAAATAPTLEWAWRAAGVRALVLARWPADDASADALLAAFYSRRLAGDSVAAALKAARAKVRAAEGTRAPAHWAGWVLLGDPR